MRMKEEQPLASPRLSEFAPLLLQKQKHNWELCRTNFENLATAAHKNFSLQGNTLVAQWNPGRLQSTSAKTDQASIAARPCFLCDENRPVEQEGIITGEYKILVNPYPLFDEHFTITHRDHKEQSIKDTFKDLLWLSHSFGEKYFLLYNGPRCGASAPDHMHFQAGLTSALPLAGELDKAKEKSAARFRIDTHTSIYCPDDGIRRYMLVEGKSQETLRFVFQQLYALYKDLVDESGEPMMNILAFYSAADQKHRIAIFPRLKHRPTLYFLPEPRQFLFSPASADLGGLCILPREEDFAMVTGQLLKSCLAEVMLPDDQFRELTNTISTAF